MEKKGKKMLFLGASLLFAFVLWTLLVSFVDAREIGPQGSKVGFAHLNEYVHNFTGVNITLYTITDWLGLVPIGAALGFAILGIAQLIKRKSVWKVDGSILALGAFYVVIIGVYILFEIVVINYRPILIDGNLEASYPSSTTMLVMCVMPTMAIQLNMRIKNKMFRHCVTIVIIAFITFMVVGRFISGVHWVTDIIGAALFSAGSVSIYYYINNAVSKNTY